jgi:hypothetical protein
LALEERKITRDGFLPAWLEVLGPVQQGALLRQLEAVLNERAASEGELRLSVPMAYLEGRASAPFS